VAPEEQNRVITYPSFRFVVDIGGETEAAFTECTLPNIEWEIEEIKEGGLNTFTHQLPGRRKAGKVSLKNGVGKSSLLAWYIDAMGEVIKRKTITISLVDSKGKAVMVWHMQNAYPVKWAGPQLKTDANSIAIQTLELACGEITVEDHTNH